MDYKEWKEAQKHEFNYHVEDKGRANIVAWEKASVNLICNGLGIKKKIKGLNILDIGCGSRLRTSFLKENNRLVAIDPLINDYKNIPFSDADTVEHYSYPAEKYINHLSNSFDIALCLNVLDHCIDPYAVVKNVYKYLKNGGDFYLWTDIGHKDHMHKGDFDVDDLNEIINLVGFNVVRITVGVDPLNFLSTSEPDYYRCGKPCSPGVKCYVAHLNKGDSKFQPIGLSYIRDLKWLIWRIGFLKALR